MADRLPEFGGGKLHEPVAALSNHYKARASRPPRDRASLAARLGFFLRADLLKSAACVVECDAAGVSWPSPLRLLDAGAGVGAAGLGAVEALRALGHEGRIHVVSLDDDAAALELGHAVWKAATPRLGDVVVDPRLWNAADPKASLGRDPYDLVVASALLCELAGPPDAVVGRLVEALAPGGILLLIEPALRETSRALLELRDRLVQQGHLTILAPCTRTGPCPALLDPRDWCHEDRRLSPSPGLARLSAAIGLRRGGLKYSYLALRAHGPTLGEASGLTRPLRVVSDPLVSKGKVELWTCGPDGRRKLIRLKRDRSESNAALANAERGDLVSAEGLEGDDGVRVGPDTVVSTWSVR